MLLRCFIIKVTGKVCCRGYRVVWRSYYGNSYCGHTWVLVNAITPSARQNNWPNRVQRSWSHQATRELQISIHAWYVTKLNLYLEIPSVQSEVQISQTWKDSLEVSVGDCRIRSIVCSANSHKFITTGFTNVVFFYPHCISSTHYWVDWFLHYMAICLYKLFLTSFNIGKQITK